MKTAPLELSVVICTYDRYDALENCIDALLPETQTAAAGAYEVMVVDNTPRQLRRPRPAGRTRVKWVVCNEVGLSNARNAGVAAAKGGIIAFVDDDALPVPTWCEEVIDVFKRNSDALAAGGKVIPDYPGGTPPEWMTPKLSEFLSCIDWGDDERTLRDGEWIVGVNMAFRSEVFADGPVFDPKLGRKGNVGLLSNEELEVIGRIGRRRIVYDPRMLVRHVIPSDRLTQTWFRKRAFWQALSDQIAGIDVPGNDKAWQEIRRILPRLPAERRNLNGLSSECADQQEFGLQLRQIYLLAHLLASGMADA